jgi:hypothetical protein
MGLVEGVDYTINRSDMVWEFVNGSQMYFMELDETKDPDFNKVKGLELTAAGIDEANEILYEAFLIVSSRVGLENRNGELAFVFMTCNPDKNWVDDKFYTPWEKDQLQAPYLLCPRCRGTTHTRVRSIWQLLRPCHRASGFATSRAIGATSTIPTRSSLCA